MDVYTRSNHNNSLSSIDQVKLLPERLLSQHILQNKCVKTPPFPSAQNQHGSDLLRHTSHIHSQFEPATDREAKWRDRQHFIRHWMQAHEYTVSSYNSHPQCLQYALRKRSRSLKVKVLPGAPAPLSVSHSTLATAASRQVLLHSSRPPSPCLEIKQELSSKATKSDTI